MNRPVCLLIVAKAPVPGFAKTRLCPPATAAQAADIAAASLLDTLDAARAADLPTPIVALTGALTVAARSREVGAALAGITVLTQRGDGLATRLANAHADAARLRPEAAILQIGMDTPQVTGDLLTSAAEQLCSDGADAVLGPATDGGWWTIGLREPQHAEALRAVPMSAPETGQRTRAALIQRGLQVAMLPTLSDVDTIADAHRVAAAAPSGRFAHAVAAVSTSPS